MGTLMRLARKIPFHYMLVIYRKTEERKKTKWHANNCIIITLIQFARFTFILFGLFARSLAR